MRKFVVSLFLIALGFVGGFAVREVTDEFWDVDRCLDLGGAWDYDRKSCRYN